MPHFERLVDEVLRSLPEEIRQALDNLQIVIEDDPSPELLAEIGHPPDEPLFGLYVGVPLPERVAGEPPYLPDQIFIFKKPLQRAFPDARQLREQIRITVVHELAHFFGFDETYLRKLGLD